MPIADERSQRDQPIEDEAPLRWSSTRAFIHDWRLPWARVVVSIGRAVPLGAALVLGYAALQGTVG